MTFVGMKNSLTLPSLANKYFSSLKHENIEPIYNYNVEYMRCFVRQSIKTRRCTALNQNCIPIISDDLFIFFLKEIDNNGVICEILNQYFEFTNKHRKIIEDEPDSQFKP